MCVCVRVCVCVCVCARVDAFIELRRCSVFLRHHCHKQYLCTWEKTNTKAAQGKKRGVRSKKTHTEPSAHAAYSVFPSGCQARSRTAEGQRWLSPVKKGPGCSAARWMRPSLPFSTATCSVRRCVEYRCVESASAAPIRGAARCVVRVSGKVHMRDQDATAVQVVT